MGKVDLTTKSFLSRYFAVQLFCLGVCMSIYSVFRYLFIHLFLYEVVRGLAG